MIKSAILITICVGAMNSAVADVNATFSNAQATLKDGQSFTISNVDVSGYGVYQIDITYNPKTLGFDITKALQTSAPAKIVSKTCLFTYKAYGSVASVAVATNPEYNSLDMTYTVVSGYTIVAPYSLRFTQNNNTFVLPQYQDSSANFSIANSAVFLNGYDDIGGYTNRTSTTLRITGFPSWFNAANQFTIFTNAVSNPC